MIKYGIKVCTTNSYIQYGSHTYIPMFMGLTVRFLKIIALVLLINACTYSEAERAEEILRAHNIPVSEVELIYNIQINNLEVTENLLLAGIDPNTVDEDEISALMWASDLGHKKIAELLIEHGADVNYANQNFFPLLTASSEGHQHIVEILVENGADVNLYNSDGVTALMGAAIGGNDDIVKMLLYSGANPLIVTANGTRAHQLALDEGHDEIALFIRGYNDR